MTANESHAEREKESRNNHHHHGTCSRYTSEEASIDTSNLKVEKFSPKDFFFLFLPGGN
jgi:hypothetical protein